MSALLQHQCYGLRSTLPFRELSLQTPAARGSERVVLGATIVFRRRPFRSDESIEFEAMQRGIQRSLAYLQCVLRNLLNALRDSPTMHGLKRQCLEDQKIQSSLQKVAHRLSS